MCCQDCYLNKKDSKGILFFLLFSTYNTPLKCYLQIVTAQLAPLWQGLDPWTEKQLPVLTQGHTRLGTLL